MPGNISQNFALNRGGFFSQQVSLVDESYSIVGNNLDEHMKSKILNHEYVDFVRLLPKDRLSSEEDHRMELVNKGGCTFFMPMSDRETSGSISSFTKWEQAFRVFSNIYTTFFPDRSSELIQYNQLIYTASLSFIWENVYRYDHEFHMHMSNMNTFVRRNWGGLSFNKHGLCI